jgi:osomolarity two-component system sensor histidine kinase NIK1
VLTDNISSMAVNLTNQVRSFAVVTKAVAGGDLTKKIEVDVWGEILEFKEMVNQMTKSLSVFAEVTRVVREVRTEGRLEGQTQVTNVGWTWKDLTDNVDVMVSTVYYLFMTFNLMKLYSASANDCCRDGQYCLLSFFSLFDSCLSQPETAVANGELTQKITGVLVPREILSLVSTINDMSDLARSDRGRGQRSPAQGWWMRRCCLARFVLWSHALFSSTKPLQPSAHPFFLQVHVSHSG